VVCAILLKRKKKEQISKFLALGVPDAVARAIIGSARCRALSIQEQ
jgi:hypothetical protein